MARDNDVELVKQGLTAVQAWRENNPTTGLDLSGAKLGGVRAPSIDLVNANLKWADLCEADLNNANLRGADLIGADLTAAKLYGADLSAAKLNGAKLGGADLRWAKLSEQTNLDGVDLSGADLREIKGLKLDGQRISGARFSPKSDPWSVLRHSYTGVMTGFHLLLFFMAVAPKLVRTLLAYAPGEQMPIALLLGCYGPWWEPPMTLFLLVYNAIRVGLTWSLSREREAEARSGCAPSWVSYRCAWAVHRQFMVWAVWPVLVLSSFRAGLWLFTWR